MALAPFLSFSHIFSFLLSFVFLYSIDGTGRSIYVYTYNWHTCVSKHVYSVSGGLAGFIDLIRVKSKVLLVSPR